MMIWGRISSEGLTELAFLDGRQSSVDYIKVLEDHFLPFLEAYYKNFSFQQDNAPIHTSKLTKTFFQRNLEVVSWPACSPDLNPIENVWEMFVKTGLQQWKAVPLQVCQGKRH